MSPDWVELCYLASAVCFILALKGLSSPRHARAGNALAAAGMLLAVVVTFVEYADRNQVLLLVAMAVGVAVGVPVARAVTMTGMPQMVALFNGVGGGAAALVSITEFVETNGGGPNTALAATVFSVLVGAVSFSGSIVTWAKLQEVMTTAPVILPGARILAGAFALGSFGLAIAVVPSENTALLVLLAVAALIFGVLFVLPIGGADVPIVISLLNAITGLAVAASGYVLDNTLLIVAGTLVGAAGTLLTRMMAQAMGRSLASILFGAFAAPAAARAVAERRSVRSGTPDDIAILLGYARKVIIVPGYGLAVAQAQHAVREVADLLSGKGIDVAYAIHPVAGRMPGHMNVLLAEADVPYDQLLEMDVINSQFGATDVAIVVGANDVVNPAARSDRDSPIFGMPILDADKAGSVVFMKRSMRPGFAGVDNELIFSDKTTMLFGDAKDSLLKIATRLRES